MYIKKYKLFLESKTYVDNLDMVENSPEFYYNRQRFINIFKGEKALLYHGTNEAFNKFDLNKSKDIRNDNYWGKGIFLTASESIAWKYAGAGMNQHLDKSIIDKAKSINSELHAFMLDLYENGNAAWKDYDTKYPGLTGNVDKHLDGYNDVDMNSIADIIRLIPDSKLAQDDDRENDSFDLFSTSSSALGYYTIKDLEKLGLGDYRERILGVILDSKGADIFMTNSQTDAKNSNADIIIVYDHSDLVDGRPEVIVKDPNRIQIVNTEFKDYEGMNESVNNKIIAYHGGGNFNSFENTQIGSANNELLFGKGFYLTSEKEMAQDFAFKQNYGYVYTCELDAKKPLRITERGIFKMLFKHLESNDNEDLFWENLSNKHDLLIIENRNFGGGMKFPTEYNDYTEYVVYDKDIIKITKKEKY
jgi:hypothetical protein